MTFTLKCRFNRIIVHCYYFNREINLLSLKHLGCINNYNLYFPFFKFDSCPTHSEILFSSYHQILEYIEAKHEKNVILFFPKYNVHADHKISI